MDDLTLFGSTLPQSVFYLKHPAKVVSKQPRLAHFHLVFVVKDTEKKQMYFCTKYTFGQKISTRVLYELRYGVLSVAK